MDVVKYSNVMYIKLSNLVLVLQFARKRVFSDAKFKIIALNFERSYSLKIFMNPLLTRLLHHHSIKTL